MEPQDVSKILNEVVKISMSATRKFIRENMDSDGRVNGFVLLKLLKGAENDLQFEVMYKDEVEEADLTGYSELDWDLD